MSYSCLKCGKEVKPEEGSEILTKIRCPYCGYKVLVKRRGATLKTIKAR